MESASAASRILSSVALASTVGYTGLLELGIGSPERWRVIPVGIELETYAGAGDARAQGSVSSPDGRIVASLTHDRGSGTLRYTVRSEGRTVHVGLETRF